MTNDHEDTVTARKAASRLRAQDADEHVRARLRECRIMRGMTHQRLAELAGISYQQEHKYETGLNRIAAAQLYRISRVLGVEIGYFYEGLESERRFVPATAERMLLELCHSFGKIPKQEHREALVELARALAKPQNEEAVAA
jgi:transcriptional regulator with XRE-family HTH domain